MLLQGMDDSVLGVWVAHGEGRLHVPDPATLDWIVDNDLAPVRYVDSGGAPDRRLSVQSQWQPAGHRRAVLSGRAPLAIMPHPERCFQLRQWPWVPPEWERAAARGCGCSATPIRRCAEAPPRAHARVRSAPPVSARTTRDMVAASRMASTGRRRLDATPVPR